MKTNKGNTTLIIVLVALLLLGFWWYNSGNRYSRAGRPLLVSNFIECAQYGYTVTSSYPRQCITPDGRVYTESALAATAYTSRGTTTTVYQPYNSIPVGTQVAYVKYPIASSTSSSAYSPSRYIMPIDSYSSSSQRSYYYTDTYSPAPPYSTYQGGCYVSGCSNQVCSDRPGMVSTCEYRPEYACYQNARCERQVNGACGWTQTAELYSCLSAAY